MPLTDEQRRHLLAIKCSVYGKTITKYETLLLEQLKWSRNIIDTLTADLAAACAEVAQWRGSCVELVDGGKWVEYDTGACSYCGAHFNYADNDHLVGDHAPDCPVARAQARLSQD